MRKDPAPAREDRVHAGPGEPAQRVAPALRPSRVPAVGDAAIARAISVVRRPGDPIFPVDPRYSAHIIRRP
jgi:hypothetical protein